MPGSDTLRFGLLRERLRDNAVVEAADLADGRVSERADLLFVAAPEKLGEKELFAIDQFLMKGGTVVLAASPFVPRSEEHTSELQSLMRISYAVFCLKKKNNNKQLQTCNY